MKTIIAITIVLLTAPVAHADQFVGQVMGGTQSEELIIQSSAASVGYPKEGPFWSYDINTDGSTLDVNEVTVSWSATGLVINPFESFDITLTAFVPPQTVSITSTATSIWKLDDFSMSSLSVSGTFYGFGGTVVPIAGSMTRSGTANFANYIQLDRFPDFVDLYGGPTGPASRTMQWTGSINIGPSFKLEQVLLSTANPRLDRIPEPTTAALALAALCLAISRRRSH